MAKLTSRRRSALDNPEEVLNMAQRLLERLKPYAKWLVLAGVVIAVGLGGLGGDHLGAGQAGRRRPPRPWPR